MKEILQSFCCMSRTSSQLVKIWHHFQQTCSTRQCRSHQTYFPGPKHRRIFCSSWPSTCSSGKRQSFNIQFCFRQIQIKAQLLQGGQTISFSQTRSHSIGLCLHSGVLYVKHSIFKEVHIQTYSYHQNFLVDWSKRGNDKPSPLLTGLERHMHSQKRGRSRYQEFSGCQPKPHPNGSLAHSRKS